MLSASPGGPRLWRPDVGRQSGCGIGYARARNILGCTVIGDVFLTNGRPSVTLTPSSIASVFKRDKRLVVVEAQC